MNDSKIPVRYARALFRSALEKNIIEKVNNDLEFVSDVCILPEFKEILENPVIKASDKKRVFAKLFEGRVEKITMS
ncbi:MAG TPA: F0F1 ATP synthase subunit delta, partial [Bacteroidales bacterium]|nr:F0F1 ATP synthase subunit delta [Bacteroidales bacterium]